MRHVLATLAVCLAVAGDVDINGAAGAQRAPQTTMGVVLGGCGCILPQMPPDLLATPVADHAVLSDAGTFIVAFRHWSERAAFPEPPIHLIAGNRRTGTWRLVDVPIDTRSDRSGPLTGITRSQGLVLVERRIALDGASTMILSPTLARVASVYHAFKALVLPSGVVFYQKAQPHLAPTHYVEMAVLDTRTGVEKAVYPPTLQAPVRRQFVELVRRRWAARGTDLFQQADHHGDPERFASNSGNLVLNWGARALAFTVSYEDADSRQRDQPPDIVEQHVMVTCDGLGALVTASCQETPLERWQALHPGASEEALVAAAAASPRRVR